MRKETRCWVVDDGGEIIIVAGEIHEFVSNVHKGPQTHVVVRYYTNDLDADIGRNYILKVFPLDKVFFKDIEVC